MSQPIFSIKLDRDLKDIDEHVDMPRPEEWEMRVSHFMLCQNRYREMLRANVYPRFFKSRYYRALWILMCQGYDSGTLELIALCEAARATGFMFMERVVMETFAYVPASFPKYTTFLEWCEKQLDRVLSEQLTDNLAAHGRIRALEIDEKLREEMKVNRHSNHEFSMNNAMERQMVRHEEEKGRDLGGYKSFKWLDVAIDGLRARDLSIIAARPGGFKTALSMNILMMAVKRNEGLKAVFINLEMDEGQMMSRFIQSHHCMTKQQVRGLDTGPYLEAMNQVFGNGRLVSTDTKHVDIDELVEMLDAYHSKGFKLFVIDYVQLIKTKTNYGVRDDLRISEAIAKLKQWKDKVKDSHIILLAQLRRHENKRVPTMSDLAGASCLEQSAAWVLIMFSENEVVGKDGAGTTIKYTGPEEIVGIFAKNRSEQTGALRVVVDKPVMQVFDSDKAAKWRAEEEVEYKE